MSSVSRFRTFCSLLVLLKITSLVCNMIIVELCSSDHSWANVSPHYHTFKIRCLSRWLLPWGPPLLVQFWFCRHHCHCKLWYPLGQWFHAQLSTQCVFICTYCMSGSVVDIVGTAGEKKRWVFKVTLVNQRHTGFPPPFYVQCLYLLNNRQQGQTP